MRFLGPTEIPFINRITNSFHSSFSYSGILGYIKILLIVSCCSRFHTSFPNIWPLYVGNIVLTVLTPPRRATGKTPRILASPSGVIGGVDCVEGNKTWWSSWPWESFQWSFWKFWWSSWPCTESLGKTKVTEDSTKCTNKGSDESLSEVDKGLDKGSNQVPNLIVLCQE